MNFPVFLNKWIIGFSPIKYSSFWWWYRLISHKGFRFDDYHIWESFWSALNHGWHHIEYVNEFEKFWGKGSYPPESIVLSRENFDSLVDQLNTPSDPEIIAKVRRVLEKKSPWEE